MNTYRFWSKMFKNDKELEWRETYHLWVDEISKWWDRNCESWTELHQIYDHLWPGIASHMYMNFVNGDDDHIVQILQNAMGKCVPLEVMQTLYDSVWAFRRYLVKIEPNIDFSKELDVFIRMCKDGFLEEIFSRRTTKIPLAHIVRFRDATENWTYHGERYYTVLELCCKYNLVDISQPFAVRSTNAAIPYGFVIDTFLRKDTTALSKFLKFDDIVFNIPLDEFPDSWFKKQVMLRRDSHELNVVRKEMDLLRKELERCLKEIEIWEENDERLSTFDMLQAMLYRPGGFGYIQANQRFLQFIE
jgi:hypothetical protein